MLFALFGCPSARPECPICVKCEFDTMYEQQLYSRTTYNPLVVCMVEWHTSVSVRVCVSCHEALETITAIGHCAVKKMQEQNGSTKQQKHTKSLVICVQLYWSGSNATHARTLSTRSMFYHHRPIPNQTTLRFPQNNKQSLARISAKQQSITSKNLEECVQHKNHTTRCWRNP
jgi:hypothetical protein